MRKPVLILVALLVVIVAGGLTLLGTLDIQPPTRTIEVTLPNDRLSR